MPSSATSSPSQASLDVAVIGGGPAGLMAAEVLAAQGETVRVLHTLRPLIVVMAGENEYDPYKD